MTDAGVLHLVALLERGSRTEAISEVVQLYERTGSVEDVVSLLAAAQREVGRRWEANQWSVAQEHQATAIVDTALALVAGHAATPATRGEVVVTCAEGEWHALPARMFAEQLRLFGFAVSFLGASTPAEHLERFVADVRPLALCLSCSVPLFLPGAARSIEAGHAAGVAVLAGGAGFGPDGHRAAALGADAWSPDARSAADLLTAGIPIRVPVTPPGHEDAMTLAALRPDLVDAAVVGLERRFSPFASYTAAQLARTREDLGYILQYVEAAILTGDDRIVEELVPWLSRVLAARGVPESAVPIGLEVLHDVVRQHSPLGAERLALAITRADSSRPER